MTGCLVFYLRIPSLVLTFTTVFKGEISGIYRNYYMLVQLLHVSVTPVIHFEIKKSMSSWCCAMSTCGITNELKKGKNPCFSSLKMNIFIFIFAWQLPWSITCIRCSEYFCYLSTLVWVILLWSLRKLLLFWIRNSTPLTVHCKKKFNTNEINAPLMFTCFDWLLHQKFVWISKDPGYHCGLFVSQLWWSGVRCALGCWWISQQTYQGQLLPYRDV